jgi:hypothetical protein
MSSSSKRGSSNSDNISASGSASRLEIAFLLPYRVDRIENPSATDAATNIVLANSSTFMIMAVVTMDRGYRNV